MYFFKLLSEDQEETEMEQQGLSKLLLMPQTVHFTGTDECNSSEVFSENVTIIPSSGLHESGSSKVKLKNVVDFNWELRFYTGQLLAVHVDGKYVAYGIKALGKNNGVVRVVNRESNNRSLLKGIEGMVQDIAFAHIPKQIILACVDEFGNLLVHEIEERGDKITCIKLLHVEQNNEGSPSSNHRVIWCPYIPEEENADVSYDDVAKLLVLTHGAKAEMWNVGMVTAKHGVGPLSPEAVEEGYLEISEHSGPIIDAAFSPDGTALATASLDGDVKFFQVYMHNNSKPRCLHQWQPHGGKPLSSLFFLDNHKTYNPEVQFWKFAITGAENNSELKIWSCESWTCIQTIKFTPEVGKQNIILKAGLDLGAGYLLLSDINYKLLYVLQLFKDASEITAHVCSASEFKLPYPILSFGIVDAGMRKFKSTSLEDLCNEDGDDEMQQYIEAVVVRMYLVQPKSLQECHIAFQPPVPVGDINQKLNSPSHDSLIYRDGFSDLSANGLAASVEMERAEGNLPANHISDSQPSVQQEQTPPPPPPSINLMTPDAFTSPGKKGLPADLSPHVDTHHMSILENSLTTSPTMINAATQSPVDDVLARGGSQGKGEQPRASSELQAAADFQRETFASGESSPSCEVQAILLSKDSEHHDHEYYDEKNIAEENQPQPSPEDVTKEKELTNKKSGDSDCWPIIPIEFVNQYGRCDSTEETSKKRVGAPIQESVENATVFNQRLCELNQKLEKSVTSLDSKIGSLLMIMEQQQLEMKNLREDVCSIRQSVPAEPSSPSVMSRIESHILSQLDKVLIKQHQQYMSLLQDMLLQREDSERKRQEVLMSAISQTVGNLVSTKLNDIVTSEIKSNVIPTVVASLEPMKHQLHIEMTQKLTSTDHLLKENISKLVHSKSVMEVLANAAVTALQPAVQNTYKEVFTNLVMPSFEKSCHTMFQQINETFSKGTREYLQSLEAYFDKQRRQQEKGKDIISQIQTLSDSLQTSQESLTSVIREEVESHVRKGLLNIQDSLNKTVSEVVKDQIDKGFQGQQDVIQNSVITAVRSRAVTPAPHIVDSQVQQLQIEQLISQGLINDAFQQALSAADLSLVVFICEKVNPQQVFNQTPCPLQQHVLLSLIQQLSADMSNYTELKHKYLEEAVMNLDEKNPVTREHMPRVLRSLQHQLSTYIASNPNNKITRSLKMLSMATQALLSSS